MNNIVNDVKSLEIETIKNLKNSKSNNTLRAYQSDFRDFSLFCVKMVLHQFLPNLKLLPCILLIYQKLQNLVL